VWFVMVIAFAVTLPASAHIPAPQLVSQRDGVAPEIEPLAISSEPVKLYDGPTSFAILTPPETQASKPCCASSDGRAQQHLMHARFYSPQWGRFLSVDPGGYFPDHPQSWNRYTYAINNPVLNTDPDGRCVSTYPCPGWLATGTRTAVTQVGSRAAAGSAAGPIGVAVASAGITGGRSDGGSVRRRGEARRLIPA
jgi:RHS repeat-associated protein